MKQEDKNNSSLNKIIRRYCSICGGPLPSYMVREDDDYIDDILCNSCKRLNRRDEDEE